MFPFSMVDSLAFLFPGQGSQYLGMGKDIYDRYDDAKRIFDEADAVLGFELSKLCFDGPEDALRHTRNAQPALVTLSIALLRCMEATVGRDNLNPRFVAGYDVGELSGVIAADAMTFADGVGLAHERGKLMEAAARTMPGAMAAIIGLPEEKIRELCALTRVEVASVNTREQFVLSGRPKAIDKAMARARASGARRAVLLMVSGAFHSRQMQEVAEAFAELVEAVSVRRSKVPIIGNANAKVLSEPGDIKRELIQQIPRSVLWAASMECLLAHRVSRFVEIGAGRVLGGLLSSISGGTTEGIQVADVETIEALKAGWPNDLKSVDE